MIGYTTLGTNNLSKATAFYNELFTSINAKQLYDTERMSGWGVGQGQPMFMLVEPYDGNPATAGNGTMVALAMADTNQVTTFYEKAISLGASCEGEPGFREAAEGFFGGYFPDFDGSQA